MKLKSDYRISRESVAEVVKEKLLEVATDGIMKACLGCPNHIQIFCMRLSMLAVKYCLKLLK